MLSKQDYRAEPADIWSCGIVLVAMLAGGNKTASKKCDRIAMLMVFSVSKMVSMDVS